MDIRCTQSVKIRSAQVQRKLSLSFQSLKLSSAILSEQKLISQIEILDR